MLSRKGDWRCIQNPGLLLLSGWGIEKGILKEYGYQEDLPGAFALVYRDSAFDIQVVVKWSEILREAYIKDVAQDVLVSNNVYIVPLVSYLEP